MAEITATGPFTSGTEGDDQITGRPEADTILARGGNDGIFGDAGDDLLDAGDGNDTVNGADGNDLILGREGNDFLFGFSGNDTFFGGPGNDFIAGVQNDDLIIGGDGNDYILGDYFTPIEPEGRDRLIGGSGSDFLAGGGQSDLFIYVFAGQAAGTVGEPEQGNDVIQDFRSGTPEQAGDVLQVYGIAAASLDSNGDGRLNDSDARVDATFILGSSGFLRIDFNGIETTGGTTAEGSATLLGVSELVVGTDIVFL